MKNLFSQNCFSCLGRRFNDVNVNENLQSQGSRFYQYLAAIFASITLTACGSYQIWSSPAVPHLISKNSKFPVTEEQIVWIVSLYNIGDLFGAFVHPLFIDRIGRKKTLLLLSLPSLIGWGLIIFAQNYIYLYVARFFGGISQASAFSSLSIYLTEISDKNVRGILVSLMQIALFLGIFIFSIIGALASYEILNISSAVLLIFFFLLSPLLPESPYYCLLQGRRADAMKILMKLRGLSSEKLEAEVNEMELVIEEDKRNSKKFPILELFKKSYNRKGLVVMFLMRATMMASGLLCVTAYAEDIFSQTDLSVKAGVQVIIFNSVTLPASLLTCLFIDKVNRRILFSATSMLASVCLASVGLFFFLKYYLDKDTLSIAWLPLVALSLLQILFIFGFGIIPHISIGELFPMKVKSSAACLGRIVAAIVCFGTIAGYKPLNDNFGIYTTFWIFASLTFMGSVLTYWTSPNTTRMSLEEIQRMQNPKLNIETGSKWREDVLKNSPLPTL